MYLYSFSETVVDVVTAMVSKYLYIQLYGDIANIYKTDEGPPHTPRSITHINFYMDEIITAYQGSTKNQYHVIYDITQDLKFLSTLLPN